MFEKFVFLTPSTEELHCSSEDPSRSCCMFACEWRTGRDDMIPFTAQFVGADRLRLAVAVSGCECGEVTPRQVLCQPQPACHTDADVSAHICHHTVYQLHPASHLLASIMTVSIQVLITSFDFWIVAVSWI